MPYLIDGHNLIPKIPGLSLKAEDDESQLIKLLQTYCRVQRQTVEVFFDGAPPGHSGVRMQGVVKARYVPQGRKADDAIADRLRTLGRSARNWRVVTSDRQVQAEARSRGAEVVPSDVFARELTAALQKADEQARDRGEVGDDDIDFWIKQFSQ